MSIWRVRLGRDNDYENILFEKGIVTIGWEELPDLSTLQSIDELTEIFRKFYPSDKPRTISNWVRQIWIFRKKIQVGDLIVLLLKNRDIIGIGEVVGTYEYRPDFPAKIRHTRPIHWIRKDFPRSIFDQDILYSFGSLVSVCQIQRNQAEERIRAIINKYTSNML